MLFSARTVRYCGGGGIGLGFSVGVTIRTDSSGATPSAGGLVSGVTAACGAGLVAAVGGASFFLQPTRASAAIVLRIAKYFITRTYKIRLRTSACGKTQ